MTFRLISKDHNYTGAVLFLLAIAFVTLWLSFRSDLFLVASILIQLPFFILICRVVKEQGHKGLVLILVTIFAEAMLILVQLLFSCLVLGIIGIVKAI